MICRRARRGWWSSSVNPRLSTSKGFESKSFRLPATAELLSLCVATCAQDACANSEAGPKGEGQDARSKEKDDQRERRPRLALAAHRSTAPALPQLGRPCPRHGRQVRAPGPGFSTARPCAGEKESTRVEAGTDFADQDLGLFEGGVVSALVGLAVVDQVGVGVFDPASGQARDVAGEHGHRDRQRQFWGRPCCRRCTGYVQRKRSLEDGI